MASNSKRNIQTQLIKRRNARRFKKAFVRVVSKQNQVKRVLHCQKYENQQLEFWHPIHFSDEAHIDSYQLSAGYILRPESYGQPYLSENMQMEHFEAAHRLHIAATVSWHHKGVLQFYNNELLPVSVTG
jgi:hypothetical protein